MEIKKAIGAHHSPDTMKQILDMTCSARSMWVDKECDSAVFMDQRKVYMEFTSSDGRTRKCDINPDVVADYSRLPYKDQSFSMVVFDPPHLTDISPLADIAQKYGILFPNWRETLPEGFVEAMRVLRPNGTLVFKWNDIQTSISEVINLFPQRPLYGHPTGKQGRTKWLIYMIK